MPPGETQDDLLRRMFDSHEELRRQFARVLHDDLGQTLSILKLKLALLSRQLGPTPPVPLQDCLAVAQAAVQRTRELAYEVRPSLLDDLGLVPALREALKKPRAVAGVTAEVVAEPPEPKLPLALATVCFRVAEEALANVVRHAQAKNVTVVVRAAADSLEIRVRDDGAGFDVATRPLGGLAILRERVRLAGGELVLRSTPGTFTEVQARFATGERKPR